MNEVLEYDAFDSECVSALHDSIETNLWQAEAYARHGEHGVARECLRTAWNEYMRFADVLQAYTGGKSLRDRLVEALVRSGDASLAGMALCDQTALWELAAA
jgi:hypothetical protein